MSAPKTPLSILVVEDEWESASMLVEVLVEAGHGVIGPVSSADGAAVLVSQSHADLALVDIGLDGAANGVALARTLKANWGVPSIFVTGQPEVSEADEAVALFTLRKPYGEAAVLDALRRGSELLQLS